MAKLDSPRSELQWMHDAACKGIHPDFMHPQKDEPAAQRAAKEVCQTCPVVEDCAEWGLWEEQGVWGGMSVSERERLRKGQIRPRRRLGVSLLDPPR